MQTIGKLENFEFWRKLYLYIQMYFNTYIQIHFYLNNLDVQDVKTRRHNYSKLIDSTSKMKLNEVK